VLGLNARAPFLVTQGLLPGLEACGQGAVVNVGSVASHGFGRQAAYDASKGAIAALTRTLAVELGPRGIRVNAVAPGLIETRLMRAAALADLVDATVPRLPLARVGHVDEIAAVIAFLASPHASYITGQSVAVDGGWIRGLF
jgi:NAD(P)-dependent dehydrogenase (short-subunit alcohol dehydrogenase family)